MSHATSPAPDSAPRRHAATVDELESMLVQPARSREGSPSSSTGAPTASGGAFLGMYLKYVGLFVGAGLISGAIVHYPLDKTRYLLIGAIGALLFAVASTFGDARARKTGPASLLVFVGASLVLALGIGMISGGIQHFSDIPTRAATLIPLGAALSLVAFAIRDGHRFTRRQLVPFAVTGSAVLVWLAIGLGQYAQGFDVPAGGHGHGTAEATSTGTAADDHTAGEGHSDAAGHAAAEDQSAPAEAGDTSHAAPDAHAAEQTTAAGANAASHSADAAADHSTHPH